MIEIVPTLGRWPKVPLGELCDIRGGFPAPQDDSAFEEKGIPFVRMKDVGRHHFTNNLCETEQSLNRSHFEEGRYQLTPRGSILMPRSGSVALNHRAILTIDAVVVSHLCALVPTSDKITVDFLYRFLCLADMRKLTKKTTGLDSIAFSDLRLVAVPLPPLPEQRRIAEVLDRAEALRAGRRAALAQLDTLTQSIFLDLFGDPATNPKGWPKGTLGDVATFVGGGTPSRSRPEFFEGTICWATSKDMRCEFLDDTQEHITPEAIQQSATNLVPAGTILIVVKSKILAHSLPVAIARVPTCFGQDLKGMKLSERADVAFVTTALRFGKRWLLERARGINTEGLTLEHLKGFPLPLPPLALQREFARRVAAVEKLKAAQRASLAELDALFASLQHRAFRGEL